MIIKIMPSTQNAGKLIFLKEMIIPLIRDQTTGTVSDHAALEVHIYTSI